MVIRVVNALYLQIYADQIAGKAGVSIICILVSLSTFGAANGSLFSGVR